LISQWIIGGVMTLHRAAFLFSYPVFTLFNIIEIFA